MFVSESENKSQGTGGRKAGNVDGVQRCTNLTGAGGQ